MLIDLEELAGEIASKVDGAGLTPVIEKEIVHYEIIRSLGRNGLLQDITFQGGTSLRLCYGSQRYSEDLDFVAGDKFDSLPLDDFSRTLRCDLLRSYDTEVSVREPKVVNDLDGVGMRRWTVSVNTNIARPDFAETANQARDRVRSGAYIHGPPRRGQLSRARRNVRRPYNPVPDTRGNLGR